MGWNSPDQEIEKIEGESLSIKIIVDEDNDYVITKVSGNFPNGISLIEKDDGYYLEGTLDLIEETTEYYFTLQASNEEKTLQQWFSITVKTITTEWDDEETFIETIEKIYFQKQFKLKNPEGNEIFKKISGKLPKGLSLSENGLLYGVPEENSDEDFNFKIGVYRNNEFLFESPILTIKVNDLSSITKPIWITDEGIIAYVNYDDNVNLSVLAYDYNGNDVHYRISDENLPAGLRFEDGKITGICQTMVVNNWQFSVTPYTTIDGDERSFIIVTNNVNEDDSIEWEEQELNNAKIGYRYKDSIKAKSSKPLRYELMYGKLPDGLKINKKGEIYGSVDFQDLGEYKFTIRVSNIVTFIQKEFTINVEKGLSKNSLDVYLHINNENQETYQEMLMNYDRTSAYNILNDEYKIPSSPRINIATICSYDPVLLKYKFNQFNTPIEIFWKETKKKSFENYDFFYKSFDERNKITETFGKLVDEDKKLNYICADIKIHNDVLNNDNEKIGYVKYVDEDGYFSAFDYEHNKIGRVDKISLKVLDLYSDEEIGYVKRDETEYENDDGTKEIRGYKRTPINESDVKIKYYTIGGEEITDIENIHQEVTEEKTKYYYTDPETGDEYLIDDPIYEPQRDVYDYVKFGRLYIGDDENKTYITPVYDGMYYIKDTKEIISTIEDIFIKTETSALGEYLIIKYIIRNGEELEIEMITEDGYASYNPFDEDSKQYLLNREDYEIIKKEDNENNYYKFDSKIISYKNASIEGLREVLSQSFNVKKFDDSNELDRYNYSSYSSHEDMTEDYKNKLWYKIGNQEIIYRKDGTVQKFDFNRYVLHHDEENNRYYIEYNGEIVYLYVWKKISDDDYRQVFADYNGSMLPVIQKSNILDGDVNYKFYCVYQLGKEFPFTNALFECEWDDNLKLICEYNEEQNIYEWFRVKEATSPYVYYADENTEYGYDKDIVLPYIIDENVVDGKVQFLDINNEKDLLPEYMEGKYTPTLPLYYAIPNSQNTRLKNINAYEKKGNYWYGRKFIFYELHFSHKFEKNIDNFTIDYYNDINNNSPEFLLI